MRSWLFWIWLVLTLLLAAFAVDDRSRMLLTNTLFVALFAAILAVGFGTLFAVAFLRTNLWGRSAGPWLLGGLLFLPLYVHIAGWETVLGKFGWWTTFGGNLETPLLSGMIATVWIHAVAGVAWTTLFAAAGLATIDPAWEEAALCDLPWPSVLRRQTLPAIGPFLALGGIWIAVQATGEMTVTNIYQVRTFAEEIYTNFQLRSSTAEMLQSLLPGLLFLSLLACGLLWLLPKLIAATTWGVMRRAAVWDLGSYRPIVSLGIWALIGLIVLVPVVSMLHQAGGLVEETEQDWHRSWSLPKALTLICQAPFTHYDEVVSTILIATAAAFVTIPLTLIPAVTSAARSGRTQSDSQLCITPWLFLLPAFIPGPVIGMSIIALLNRPEDPTGILTKLYDDTLLPPILAVLPRTIPIAGLILWATFRSTPQDLRDQASLQANSRWRQSWLIVWGTYRGPLLASLLASLSIAAGDLTCSILVLPPGVQTVAFHVFQLLHSGCDDRMAALCLAQFLATAAIGGLIATLLRSATRENG